MRLYIYPGVHLRRLSLDCISESNFSQLTLQLAPFTHCNTLQHTAAHCKTLQHTATHCNTLIFNVDSSLSPAHFFEKVRRLVWKNEIGRRSCWRCGEKCAGSKETPMGARLAPGLKPLRLPRAPATPPPYSTTNQVNLNLLKMKSVRCPF